MPAKRNVTKETSKVIFLHTRGHGRIKLFQLPADGKLHCSLALRMTTKTLTKPTPFAL